MKPDKPKDVLDKARAAFRDGNYAESLEHYEYFFDHALEDEEHNFYGVRLSYCLEEWVKLAQRYPVAMKRLETKRDDALSLLAQTRDAKRFHDFISICQYLKCEKRPLEQFLIYHTSDPELAKSVFVFIRDGLAEAEKWDVYATYITNPFDEYNGKLELLDQVLKLHEEEGWDNSRVKRRYVRDVSNLLLVLKNIGKINEVASLQNSLSSDMLSRGLPELAKDISQRAGLNLS